MKAIRDVLGDRRRRQRGSVLSGVLIIVAFLAIISGALVTSLSTQFLISRVLVNRVSNEATLNSAMELSLDQIQNTALASGCPGMTAAPQFPPVTLNGRTAGVSYASCWPTIPAGEPRFSSIAAPAAFNVDGTHSVIPGSVQDLYVVGDSSGTIYSYQFGQKSPSWPPMNLGTSITGPPMAMQDAACRDGCPDTGTPLGSGNNADISFLVPIAGVGSGCTASFCVELLGQDTPNPPDRFCFMAARAKVTSRPAAGVAFPQVAYFGDTGGNLYAYDATEFCPTSPGPAVLKASQATPGNAAIVAGPIVVRNGASDEIYVVTSTGSTSQLLWYEYGGSSSFTVKDTALVLPFRNPVGLAVENVGVAPRIAITFADGQVAIVKTNSSFDPTLGPSGVVGSGGEAIANAPYWCSCPAGQQIGVGGLSGTLYVLDTNLNAVAWYAGGSPIRTSPGSDGVGEWFFGADDGYVHELQQPPGPPPVTMVQVATYGGLGSVGSSVQVAGCPAGICIYLGSSSNAYLVPLDARDAVMNACIGTCASAPGGNPRLWSQVEVCAPRTDGGLCSGVAGSLLAVHVQGWSYYSP